MKPTLICISMLYLFLGLTGCAGGPVGLPQFSYQEKAVQINLRSDPKLHWHEGSPHTLMLCVYQLRDLNGFSQMSSTNEGLYQLLECRTSDPSMVTSNRVFIQPGDSSLLTYDRAEGTRYVGVIAGYFDMHEENMVRKAKIPVTLEVQGFFSRTEVSTPGPLNMDIRLGRNGITSP
jgi:type VI secretion system VasD/TssJ family lipoprotein